MAHSKGFFGVVRDTFFPKKGTDAYESRERLRKIAKENKKRMREFEKQKEENRDPSYYQTTMRDPNNLVEFDNLQTHFFTDVGVVKAVDGVSFDVPKGKTVGIVGESGCGKSVTSLSLMRLVQAPSGQIVGGSIRFNNGDEVIDIAKTPMEKMRKLRGNDISMIFQEPMTSLNPVFTIGDQIDEVIMLHNHDWDSKKVKDRTIEMLELVGMSRPTEIYDAYPHELSGGMRQRVMIAMALACTPKLLIADEPTTALDVTIQAQILDLMRNVKDRVDASIMLITHDLGVIAEMADLVVVMYAGRIIEKGTASDIYHNPLHPYTQGLILSKPAINRKQERLYSIPGSVPNPISMPNHCYFKDRCEQQICMCEQEYPPMIEAEPGHFVACYRYCEAAGYMQAGMKERELREAKAEELANGATDSAQAVSEE